MIEPVHEKEARSDHHNRQTLRKPGDRSKKFNQKNATKPKSPQQASSAGNVGSFNRTHGKRIDFIKSPGHGHGHVRTGSGEFGEEEDDDTETEARERALMIMQGAREGTGTITRGIDGIVLDETREAATLVPIEELLAAAYAKKPKKPKADRYDHIRGLGKQHVSLAPRSVASSRVPKRFPHEHEEDSDWESIGEDGTEAWDYNSEWRAEMGGIMGETVAQKTSYRDALAQAAVVSLDSTLGSETSEATDKTDDLP